jgi:ribonuclease T2
MRDFKRGTSISLSKLVVSAMLACALPGAVTARDLGQRAPGAFDYYVLALLGARVLCDDHRP